MGGDGRDFWMVRARLAQLSHDFPAAEHILLDQGKARAACVWCLVGGVCVGVCVCVCVRACLCMCARAMVRMVVGGMCVHASVRAVALV